MVLKNTIHTSSSPVSVRYVADGRLEEGKTRVGIEGSPTVSQTVISYRVNPETGEVSRFETTSMTTGIERVIYVGTRRKSVISKTIPKTEFVEDYTLSKQLSMVTSRFMSPRIVKTSYKGVVDSTTGVITWTEKVKVIAEGKGAIIRFNPKYRVAI